ncbi:uncharacterized protein LTR77_009306 [Saxophila tyrrhenica]|uniref:Uncharacterized protein n=1 Tax=Saxophila tyrrhenica TaxID=1690608 RepID=A0AAV9NZG7_9PEZI|nr:hypothetical protein LTR77_009306 [Saxophila tyrrhenica]
MATPSRHDDAISAMLNLADPAKPWNDVASPTSPSAAASDKTAKTPRKKSPAAENGPAVQKSPSPEDAPPAAEPTPTPRPHYDPNAIGFQPAPFAPPSSPFTPDTNLELIRHRFEHRPNRPRVSTSFYQEIYDEFGDIGDRDEYPEYPRTPTPTTPQFREVLDGYWEIPEQDRDGLAELALPTGGGDEGAIGRLQGRLEGYTEMTGEEVGRLVGMAEVIARKRVERREKAERDAARAEQETREAEEKDAKRVEEENRAAEEGKKKGEMLATTKKPQDINLEAQVLKLRKTQQEALSQAMSYRVHATLLPAKRVLKGEGEMLTAEHAQTALLYAYEALRIARSFVTPKLADDGEEAADTPLAGCAANDEVLEKAAVALQGRCAYYVGVAEFVLWKTGEGSELAMGKERDVVLGYFELALRAADGGYHEGKQAEEWVKFLESGEDSDVEDDVVQKEKGEGSWSGWLAEKVLRRFSTRSAASEEVASEDDRLQGRKTKGKEAVKDAEPSRGRARRRKSSEAGPSHLNRWRTLADIPSGSSGSSFADGYASPSSEDEDGADFLDDNAADVATPETSSRLSDLNLRSYTDDDENPGLPPPVTSPQLRAKSIVIKVPTSPTSATSSPKSDSIYDRRHSRKSSILASCAKVTGREKHRSELEEAEEGESPFRDRFQNEEKRPGGLTKRRVSQGRPEDMV